MDENQRTALLEDYKGSYNFAISFSTMRVTAYSVSVAFVGLVASFALQKGFQASVVGSIVLIGATMISTQILITLNRGTFIFMLHLRSVERYLGIAGFSTAYLLYVKSFAKNTGIYAFWLAAMLLNLTAHICAWLLLWVPVATEANTPNLLVPLSVSAASICALLWTLRSLNKQHPAHYEKDLTADYNGIHRDCMNECGILPPKPPQ